MRIKIDNTNLERFIRHLASIDARTLQKEAIAPALRSSARVWLRVLKDVVADAVSTETGSRRINTRDRRLFDTLSTRVFAKVSYAPNVLLTVGTKPQARTVQNQPPASARLNFLGGTEYRETQDGQRRGRIEDRGIDDTVEAQANTEAFSVFSENFNSRADDIWAFYSR